MSSVSRVAVVLPVYREGRSIYDLLTRLAMSKMEKIEVIVVDDCSQDSTLEWIQRAATEVPSLNCKIIMHDINRGLGGALNTGIDQLMARPNANFTAVITMDGDNTHDPTLIPEMVRRIEAGADIVVASRFQRGAKIVGVPAARQFLSYGARLTYTLRWQLKGVRDYTCLYRAYSGRSIAAAYKSAGTPFLKEKDFVSSAELLRKVARFAERIEEVPISLNYSRKSEPSNMKIFKTILRTVTHLLRVG